MGTIHEDHYVVFLRSDLAHADRPDVGEQDLILCDSHAEARRVRRQFRGDARECVIRFVGTAGGGD